MSFLDQDLGLTAEVRSWFEPLGASALASTVCVRWNKRMRSTAGTAHPRSGQIDLNLRLLTVSAAEVDRTLRHEAAHLLAHWRAGRRRIQTHGAEWRQACVDLGIPGETVTHTLPFPRRKIAPKYGYQCPSCAMLIGRIRLFKRPTACRNCCRKQNGGQFDPRFQFRRVPLAEPPAGPVS